MRMDGNGWKCPNSFFPLDQSCIDDLIAIMALPVVLNTTALDTTIQSQYKPDSTIGDIIDQLMVEQWIEESSHEMYYAQCNSATFSASYKNNNDFVVVFSITIGVVGILPILLEVIVPRAVKKLWSCCKNHDRSHQRCRIYPAPSTNCSEKFLKD